MTFLRRRQFLRQSPRIAVLFQAMHDIIGNSVAFFFRQFLACPGLGIIEPCFLSRMTNLLA
jgi:hypothetical protein